LLPKHHQAEIQTVDLLKAWRVGDIHHCQELPNGLVTEVYSSTPKTGYFEAHGASLFDLALRGLEEALDDAE
jgi:hypothetical protein